MELLTPGFGLIFWTTVIFVLLVVLLRLLAWKPILAALKEREKSIQQALDSAEKAKQEMASLKTENEKLFQEARNERDEILRHAREAANLLEEKAKTDARTLAEKIVADAKAVINFEKQKAINELKNEISSLSIQIAGKILKKNLANDPAQKELAEAYIKEINPS